ncbi:putative ABC transport system ATP-binding protein [Hasllibacter halocynthiae]|uniref:Putative ABC transport system ATP-binding protein n=1 Tax=Hasllibacter halocynthiae TaxID=595589 RepID=A0A2T0X977_9RHOB|nr:ABC transporter ATP-binding protein [Hasllibacter halocynthiae]PRY95479.1 putative ABC transport system ATP-binding protein [Hasllibacter halocynthiae]
MLLEMAGVEKAYPGEDGVPVPVLRGLDLTLAAGETLALTGESGSGKSTALNLAAGLDEADAGRIAVEGRDVSAMGERARATLRRERIGLVFQQFNLVPSLDVGANLAFQARLAGREADVAPLAERLGLAAHLSKYPEQLSGGQQQRVAIGRALAARPALILADEPTGNLDEATGAAVMEEMLALVRETGAGLLVVTHSATLAGRMDRRVHLKGGVAT